MLKTCAFIEETRTLAAYTLMDFGPYPGMIHPGQMSVFGELYDVPSALIPQLDEYEDHPHLFRRGEVELQSGSAISYLYVGPIPRRATIVVSGDWRARGAGC